MNDAHAFTLRPFDPVFAPMVASWVRGRQELHWLAPATPYPLTAAKVVGWTRKRGAAYLLFGPGERLPCGYGEVNAMRDEPRHAWLGHLVIDVQRRRMGIGRQLSMALINMAFQRNDSDKLTLVVFPENVPAIRCYLSCGFHLRGEEFHQFNGRGRRSRLLRLEMHRPAFTDTGDDQRAADALTGADFA